MDIFSLGDLMTSHNGFTDKIALYVNHRTWDDKMSPYYADEDYIDELRLIYGKRTVDKEIKRQVWLRDFGYEP